jgi:hypothetical protein
VTTPTVAQPAVRRRAPVAAWTVVAACTTAVVVFATIRGLARGYEPVGDNALIELRARDVFTDHWPLLGTWSSASVAAGQDLNHPGPLLFDLFAVPVRLLGGRVGIAVGAAALNIAALWGSALAARRVGGDVAALATALAAAVLAWTMGSEVLFDAWQPNILVLPFFAFLVLVWAVFAGHGTALPWAVAVGSLCVQAHLSYLFVVPALLGAGVVALWLDSRAALWRRHGRALLLALAVGLLAWAQPLLEQVFGPGRGNISRLAGGSDDGVRSGLTLAVRMIAAVLAIPPAWFRPGYDTAIPLTPWTQTDVGRVLDPALPALGVAALGLVALVAAVVGIGWWTSRQGDPTTPRGVAVFLVTVGVGMFSAAITPIDIIGLSPHKLRWLWPAGAFVAACCSAGVGRVVAARWNERGRAAGRIVGVAIAVVVSLLTLPTYVPAAGPVDQPWSWRAVADLRGQMDAVEDAGVVLFDPDALPFAEPFSAPLMAELGRLGVPFVVGTSGLARQVGRERAFRGTADVRLFFQSGDRATVTPPGARLIGSVETDVYGTVAAFVEPYDGSFGAVDG